MGKQFVGEIGLIFLEKSTFFEDRVVTCFLAADIPLKKLNNPAIKSLFEESGKSLPLESSARSIVSDLA